MIGYNNQVPKEFNNVRAISAKDPLIKLFKDLIKGKKVEDERLFVVEGLWAYEKLLSSNVRIEAFLFCPEFITNSNLMDMTRYFVYNAEKAFTVSISLCDKISGRDGAEGFFLLCSMKDYKLSDIELKDNNLVVLLDGLEKSGNIGTIIRSVDAAGGDGVIICNSKVRKTNQKLIKSSMGSSFVLPIVESDISTSVQWLKSNGFTIIVTDLKASSDYYNANYNGRIAIVAGNEIRGISDLWKDYECQRVIIPMFGRADSLNVGVAATLVIYEACRQQRQIIGT